VTSLYKCNFIYLMNVEVGFILREVDIRLSAQSSQNLFIHYLYSTQWRSCLRHCAGNRKVAGSIPEGVIN
jgi:hypothetical protein